MFHQVVDEQSDEVHSREDQKVGSHLNKKSIKLLFQECNIVKMTRGKMRAYIVEHNVQYDFRSSVIVTGCNPWTLYKETGYMGDSVCLFPADSDKRQPFDF